MARIRAHRKFGWLGVSFVLVVSLQGCDDSLAKAHQRLTVGYAVEAPYAYVDPQGVVTGEAPEVARVVAQRLHLGPLVWRQVPFDRLFSELRNGTIDLVAAGTFITPERQKLVAFSLPTFRVHEAALILRPANGKAVPFHQGPGDSGWRWAVLAGSAEVDYLVARGWSVRDLTAVADLATALASVRTREVDALALSSPTLRHVVASSPTQEFAVIIDDAGPSSVGGFAFRKEDGALREAWNQVLKDFVGSEDHRRLVSRWGFTVQELP